MSDGPYRSLPLAVDWKNAAKYAENEAFDEEDICVPIIDAVSKDAKRNIQQRLRMAIKKTLDEMPLLNGHTAESLEMLRSKFAGNRVAMYLLDNLILFVTEGMSGDTALQKSISKTLKAECMDYARQIEEHYARRSNKGNSKFVRQRIEAAVQSIDFDKLSQEIMNSESGPINPVPKRDQLDDGVKL